jgi:hypothetical protein
VIKHRFGIHSRCVSNVTAFCISNDEMVIAYERNGFLHYPPSFQPERFIKSEIDFIGNTYIPGGIDDSFVESQCIAFYLSGQFLKVSIEPYGQYRTFCLNVMMEK